MNGDRDGRDGDGESVMAMGIVMAMVMVMVMAMVMVMVMVMAIVMVMVMAIVMAMVIVMAMDKSNLVTLGSIDECHMITRCMRQ